MTKPTNPNQPRTTAAEVTFLAEMLRELERIYAVKKIEYGLASDAISLAQERVVGRLGQVIAGYGTGGRYAAAIHENTRIDAYRTANAQRGAGFGNTRKVSHIDETVEQAVVHQVGVEDEFTTSQLLKAMVGRMTPAEERDFVRVHIAGLNYTEVARLNHEAHTTSMRRVNKATAKARSAAIEFLGYDPSLPHRR
jgi:DNA-directed RNA polymerase specialized sigma24 family protein